MRPSVARIVIFVADSIIDLWLSGVEVRFEKSRVRSPVKLSVVKIANH